MNLLSVLAKGGWLMIFIGIFSLIALGIFLERLVVLRKAKINLNAFLMKIRQYITKQDYDNALYLCSQTPGPISNVLEKGIRLRNQTREEIKDAIESAAKGEIYKLEKKLNPMDVYHLLKIADWVDDIADHAENVADWLRAMIAK